MQKSTFAIRDRFTRTALHIAHIEHPKGATHAVRLGLAVTHALDLYKDLSCADLRGARLRNCDLRDAAFNGADLRKADFTGSRMNGVDLHGCDCREADFTDCDMDGADMRFSDFRFSKAPKFLGRANVEGAWFDDASRVAGNVAKPKAVETPQTELALA